MTSQLYRRDFRNLANKRLTEAKVLFDLGHFSGSYHLAGLAVECGLKACIARLTNNDQFPDKKHANNCFDHQPKNLVGVAGLQQKLQQEQNANPTFNIYWTTVKDWNVDSRYEVIDESTAKDMLNAINHRRNGVMRWIRKYW